MQTEFSVKKILKKVGLIIMSLATIFSAGACTQINNDVADMVKSALYEKYGEEFEAEQIGDRLNTGHAKLYLHPTANEDLVFVATIDNETKEVEDNYAEQKVNYQIREIIRTAFEEESLNAYARSVIVTTESFITDAQEYTPASFQATYGFDHYTVYLLIENKNIVAEKIREAMLSAEAKIGVKTLFISYILESENYMACAETMKKSPEMSSTGIEKNSPISTFSMLIEQGNCSLSEEELRDKIGG